MKKFLIIVFLALNILLFSQINTPKIFKLDWGINFYEVENKILSKDFNFIPLVYYQISKNKSENDDLQYSSNIKYKTNGVPFLNIPAEIIFTFYNQERQKSKLKLSKVELYLSKRDKNNVSIDIKSIFRTFIGIFCENYGVYLESSLERNIFTNYSYQVTVNGIYVNFMANIGENKLEENESIFISYENNELQNLILKREVDLLKLKEKKELKDEEYKINNMLKNNL